MHKKILHGLDGSAGSLKALEEALDLARLYGAELHTVSVEEVPHYTETIGEFIEEKDALNGTFKDALRKAREMAAAKGVAIQCHVIVGHEVKNVDALLRIHRGVQAAQSAVLRAFHKGRFGVLGESFRTGDD